MTLYKHLLCFLAFISESVSGLANSDDLMNVADSDKETDSGEGEDSSVEDYSSEGDNSNESEVFSEEIEDITALLYQPDSDDIIKTPEQLKYEQVMHAHMSDSEI